MKKIAIIGSGFGAYGLLPAFSKAKGCKVVSICAKNSERIEKFCKEFDVKRYDEWMNMLQEEKPDVIAIAVIPEYQYEIAKYALQNNIAVFAEKPLTTSISNAVELYNLADDKQIPNMVDFLFPEIPEWKLAKKTIGTGTIGKIHKANIKWNFLSYDLKNNVKSWKTDVEKGGGALSFYFSHVFNYLEYFIGTIKNLQCKFSYSEKSLNKGETGVSMKIVFESGCIADVNLDISFANKQEHIIEFFGEKGEMTLQNISSDFIDNFELTVNTQKIKPKNQNLSHNKLEDSRVKIIIPMIERFINWCNNDVLSKPNFQDGLRVQELIELARKSNLRTS